jgi:hypothetical protein
MDEPFEFAARFPGSNIGVKLKAAIISQDKSFGACNRKRNLMEERQNDDAQDS